MHSVEYTQTTSVGNTSVHAFSSKTRTSPMVDADANRGRESYNFCFLLKGGCGRGWKGGGFCFAEVVSVLLR